MPTEEQTYRLGINDKLDDIKKDQIEIKSMVKYTNGKVRKLIISMVFLSGAVVGLTLSSHPEITSIISNFIL